MKNKISLLFALLCVSIMAFADDPVTGSSTDNMDGQPGFTNGYDYSFSTEGTSVTISFTEKEDYVGLVAYLWNYTNGFTETQMAVSGHTASITLTGQAVGSTLDFACKFAFSGGMSVTKRFTYTVPNSGGDPTPDPDPTPTGIDWSSIAWLTNASGNAAYTEKYKAHAGDPGPSNIDVIQSPGWATKPGIYMTFPNADFRNFSLPASCYSIQGAGIVFHMDAFTAKETTVHVNVGGTVRSFTIFYVDGTDEPAEIYDINFALVDNGASATSDNGGTANNAIDNNDGTSWESTHGVDAVKLTIDLGQKRIFNTVQIRWEGAYGKAFTIDVSNDNDTWTTVKTVDEELSGFPHEQTLEFAKTTARYIRFNGTQRGTQWGYNMFSFRVLLPGVSVLTSIDLTAPAQIAEVSGTGVALTAQPKDQNGQNMEAEISWEITPAAAGHMSGNTFIPNQAGSATIRAYSGEIYSPAVTVVAYTGSNVALEKDVEASGYDDVKNLFPSFAVDNNEGSLWSARAGETGADRVYDAWIIVDLGAFYDINLIALRWEGACSKHYHVDFSADKSTWRTAYNAGWDAIATHWEYLSGTAEDATKVQYVRVWSTEAVSQYGVKIMDLKVFGTVWIPSGDTEAPVMTSASLVSSTSTSAVIAVAATDADGEVARYHVVDATNGINANYIPEAGNITITGLTHATEYNFTITAVDLAAHESENSIVVAVSTPFDVTINLALNKTCEAGYDDGNPAEVAAKANDGENSSAWVTYGAHAAELDWWIVDLGQTYNLTNITALWADDAYATNYILQARVAAPATADKANDAAWVTLATVSGVTAGEERSTDVSGVGRYIRFRATAHTGFFRLREFRVYASGVADVDTEAPVMSSASLVSNTDSHAVIAVAATDNVGVAKFHVVDAVNNIDAEFVAEAGNITVTGLSGGTTYNFVITAIDFFGNESANSKSVAVTTAAHYTEPHAACLAPTWDATWVKAMYSPTYSADCGFDAWGSGSTFADDTYGKKCTVGNAYFGMVGFALNCLMMEKVHFDIWVADDMTIRFVPIGGDAEQGITKSLTGQEWNSIDIDLADYTNVTNWGNIIQFKLDQMQTNFNLWIANAYFYRTSAIVDNEAPTNVSASVTAQGFKSVKITAQAEDNSGAVNFKVMNGTTVMATGAAATATATEITIDNLASGTNYNFNVVAYDEAGNEAEPVLVATATKFMPTPAPAPVFSGKNVIPVFTDAMSGAPAEIHSGGWGESTQYEWVDIASGDKVFYAQNFNWAGWHSWGADIDATNMMFLHVDVYSTGMTQFSVTPISHDPTREGSATINLTPNAWTSYDVPLSAYAANNIEWNKIFQFKFMNPVGGNEFMIDNVYFWQPVANTTPDNGDETGGWATFSCAEKVAVPTGVTAYKAVYEKTATEEILQLSDIGDVIPAGAGVILKGAAGTAYAFSVTDATPTEDMSDNMLVGCPVRTDITSVLVDNDVFCLRYSELYSLTGFFLYTGQYVPAGKAYLALPKAMPGAGSTTDRGLRFVINDSEQTTAITSVETENTKITKFVENGQLFIRRGDTVYTIQGTRVK